jgi:GAF domain-containing protein
MIYGRQSVVWDDPAEARETGIPALSGKTVRSLAGIPLLAGGDAIGGIVLLDIQRSQVYAREDLLWLEPLASQLASSLQSGLIVESSKQQFVLDRRLFEVANNIRNSPDMRSILAATAIELGKVLQAQKVHIVIAPEFLTQTDIPASGVEAAPGDSTPGAEAAPGLEAPNG